jgi:hypothetical protein
MIRKKPLTTSKLYNSTGNEEEVAYAKQKYQDQIGDFKSYLDYLKSQQSDLQFKISVEPNNVGLQESLVAINKAINSEQNKQSADRIKQQIDDYTRLFAATATFNQKRKQIDEQYYKDIALLARQYSGKELEDRIDILKQGRQASVDADKDEVFQKTALYQKLNQDIVEMSRKQVKAEMEAIQTTLSKGVDLPPELQKQLKDKLGQLQEALNHSSRTNYINELEQEKAIIEASLKSGLLSTEEFKKQEEHLKNINAATGRC